MIKADTFHTKFEPEGVVAIFSVLEPFNLKELGREVIPYNSYVNFINHELFYYKKLYGSDDKEKESDEAKKIVSGLNLSVIHKKTVVNLLLKRGDDTPIILQRIRHKTWMATVGLEYDRLVELMIANELTEGV